jgi:hypothetical protein
VAIYCVQCGKKLFVDETRCPRCKAVVPDAIQDAVADRGGVKRSGTGPPPPEGLGLIVEKARADKDIIGDARRREAAADGLYESAAGATNWDSDGLDDLADLMKPERDAQGNVKWDPVHALVGGVVVAVACGLIFYYLSWRYSGVTSSFSRIS